jgi:formylglycine-generating enzyme required for sulfatase activity
LKKEKKMKTKSILVAILICLMAVTNFASADTIRGINMDFVTIGHADNSGDIRTEANPYGCGAVGYNYRIGKSEVTNAQWDAFTATVGAPSGTDGGYGLSSYWTGAQKPTNNISWYETAQFCNYLTSGDKSKGAYQFSGNNAYPGAFQGINRAAAISAYGIAYVLPTEDEWYKAAYFKPDGSGYSFYANGTSTAPVAGVQSNYNYAVGAPWNVETGTQEQNGTFDMMGNVWEWNETLVRSSFRGIRGGSYYYGDGYQLASSTRFYYSPLYPYNEDINFGFRVASIPEPATILLLGLSAMILRKKR